MVQMTLSDRMRLTRINKLGGRSARSGMCGGVVELSGIGKERR